MKQYLATLLWNVSEFLGIRLGKYAPRVFGVMTGSVGVCVREPMGKFDIVCRCGNIIQHNDSLHINKGMCVDCLTDACAE